MLSQQKKSPIKNSQAAKQKHLNLKRIDLDENLQQHKISKPFDYASSLRIEQPVTERDPIGRIRSESEVPYKKNSTLIAAGSTQNKKKIEKGLKSTRSDSRKQHTLTN